MSLQSRNEIEKAKRKLEGDLRCSREAIGELERNKNELSQAFQRKEKELSAIAAKIEDEQSLGTKLSKQTKPWPMDLPVSSLIILVEVVIPNFENTSLRF